MNITSTHRVNPFDPRVTVCGLAVTETTSLAYPESIPTCPECRADPWTRGYDIPSVTQSDPVQVMGLSRSVQMGMGVHYVRSLGLDEDDNVTHILCQAALVVWAHEQPVLDLAVFSRGANMMPVRKVAYDAQRSEVDTWHHLMECDQ